MLKVILNRLQPQAEEIIAEEQAGLRIFCSRSLGFVYPMSFVFQRRCRRRFYIDKTMSQRAVKFTISKLSALAFFFLPFFGRRSNID